MAEFYKILKADPLGEPWESHGKQNQTWWCQVEGQDKAVSIGKAVGNQLYPGQHVYGDLVYAKSQKGTEYWKFKTAQVPDGVQRPQDSAAPAPSQEVGGQVPGWFTPYGNMITYIYEQMKAMDTEATDNTTAAVTSDPDPTPDEGEPMPPDFLKVDDPKTPDTIKTVFGE